MGASAPRLAAAGILLIVVAVVLGQAGKTPWAAVAAFIVGLLLVGQGLLRLILGAREETRIAPVDTLAEVDLHFPQDGTHWRVEGLEGAPHPPEPADSAPSSKALLAVLDQLPVVAQDADSPALVVTAQPPTVEQSLLTITRIGDQHYQVVAQRWPGKKTILRYTGEVGRAELQRALEESYHDLTGESDAPGGRRAGE